MLSLTFSHPFRFFGSSYHIFVLLCLSCCLRYCQLFVKQASVVGIIVHCLSEEHCFPKASIHAASHDVYCRATNLHLDQYLTPHLSCRHSIDTCPKCPQSTPVMQAWKAELNAAKELWVASVTGKAAAAEKATLKAAYQAKREETQLHLVIFMGIYTERTL